MLVLVMDAESSLEPCLEPKGNQEEEEAKHNEGEVTENSKEQAGHGKTSTLFDKLDFEVCYHVVLIFLFFFFQVSSKVLLGYKLL